MSSISLRVLHPTVQIDVYVQELFSNIEAQLNVSESCGDVAKRECLLGKKKELKNLGDGKLLYTEQGFYDSVLTIEFEASECETTVCCDVL